MPLQVYDIIKKKREGETLSRREINYLIQRYSTGDLPDYQMAAWAMAVYFRGLNEKETVWLTGAMADSGQRMDLSSLPGIVVDKHSTGGVGDTTTLVLLPLVAAAGIPAAKMSGRGLGHTGGTVDKLEAIPGFKVEMSRSDFLTQVKKIGVAVVAQTPELAPVDKKLYALRDVTATVESLPLIASSIMSKKIAGGASGLVLDVKVGRGAFMKDKKQAEKLARLMVKIGEESGLKTRAVLSAMNQPLGFAVGNSLEVIEAFQTLKGQGPADLEKLCLTLGSCMLQLAGKEGTYKQHYSHLQDVLHSGQALEKMRQLIEEQKGDPRVIDNYNMFPEARYSREVKSRHCGYAADLDALKIGNLARKLGAGRSEKGEQIDPAAGIVLQRKRGDRLQKGELLARLYTSDPELLEESADFCREAFRIKKEKPQAEKLVYKMINSSE